MTAVQCVNPKGMHHYHVAEVTIDKDNRVAHVIAICLNCADLQVKRADLSK